VFVHFLNTFEKKLRLEQKQNKKNDSTGLFAKQRQPRSTPSSEEMKISAIRQNTFRSVPFNARWLPRGMSIQGS
jgi:hypothetical protein